MRISDWSSDECSSDHRAELRAERKSRAGSIVDHEPERYRQFTLPALRSAGIAATEDNGMLVFSGLSEQARRHAARIWAMRRVQGKLLSVLRPVKASANFSGGTEYLALKTDATPDLHQICGPGIHPSRRCETTPSLP